MIGPVNGNLTHGDIIYIASKLDFSKHDIYDNNTFS